MADPTRRHPAHISERKAGPWDDCTLASGGMAADAATGGRMAPTRAQMRTASGVVDHVATSDPTNLSDVARAIDSLAPALYVQRLQDGLRISLDDWIAALRGNTVGIAIGLYSGLPAQFTRHDPNFAAKGVKSGHATFVMWDGAQFWWDDPLGPPAGYVGEPIPESVLRAFVTPWIWNGVVLCGLVDAVVPLDPHAQPGGSHVAKFVLAEGYTPEDLPLRVDAPAGTPIFELDSDVAWTTLKTPAVLITGGLVDGHSGEFHVLVSTGRFAPDHESRDYWQRATIKGALPRQKRNTDPR